MAFLMSLKKRYLMNIIYKQLGIYLNRYEFFFSSKRIKVCEPKYIDLDDSVTTIMRDHDKFSLFAYQGIIFVVYFIDKNEAARKFDSNIPLDCVWEICKVLQDKTWQKVTETAHTSKFEECIKEYVEKEANAIF